MLKQIIFLISFFLVVSSVSFAQKACCTKDKSTYEKSSTEQVDSKSATEKNHCDVDAIKTSESENKSEVKAEQTVFNTVCPVMGKPVDAELTKVEYEGKIIAFCCSGCEDKFKANPEKFMKNLSEDGKTFLGKKRS
ncbi:MAG: YHS domain-containing protein [Ignavibacterium sp.]|nr:YHS domain-containing protein [Ignavibacterium sp.]MDW8375197.1 YHS domain-containing protein [Ignavibacteriales bacterium]